jgi:hypothetical protein
MDDQWRYFGVMPGHTGTSGHFVYGERCRRLVQRHGSRDLSRFDGVLPPQTNITPYVATVSRLEGWGLTALAFWDYSVDPRGGSNSIVFAPTLDITPEALLEGAVLRFPEVFARLPRPITWYKQP